MILIEGTLGHAGDPEWVERLATVRSVIAQGAMIAAMTPFGIPTLTAAGVQGRNGFLAQTAGGQ
jgi:urea transporter